MRIDKSYKIRSVADQSVIILQGRHGIDTTKVLSLNETALWLWEQFGDGAQFSVEDVQDTIMARFDIDLELARRDALAWVDMLSKYNVIIGE